ncbi:MAG: TetR/AcrR family transcriptional regulator [Lysinibacillus sp.]
MVKKQMIMDNALELFAQQGFEATSIQQITDKCGISKGAFYLSFKSKDELIFSLLDCFLEDLLYNCEQVVTNSKDDSQLLYEYCMISFKNVEKNMALAQVFIQEMSSMINNAIFERLQSFHVVILRTLQTIIRRQFSQVEPRLHDELVFVVNSLMKNHTEQMLHQKEVGPIAIICHSIEEKTSILAEHMTITTVANNAQPCLAISKERLIALIKEKESVVTNPIELESLQLLQSHIESPSLSPALEVGILHNLQASSGLKYIAYMYENYKISQ